MNFRSTKYWFCSFLCAVVCSACSSTTDGIEVQIAYQAPATPLYVQTTEYVVALDEAYITMESLELVRCDSGAAQQLTGLPSMISWLRSVTISRAKAHTTTTGTQLGVPIVLNLLHSTGTPTQAGLLRPPPGLYCGIAVVGMPPDADAVGLPTGVSDLNAITLKGAALQKETRHPTEVALEVGEFEVDIIPFAEPLRLDSTNTDAVLVVHMDHLQWFDDMDFEFMNEQSLRDTVLKNIEASFETRLTLLPTRKEIR